MKFFRRPQATSAVDASTSGTAKQVPKELLWLLDAPLFIDDLLVEAFYDAILRPELDATALQLSKGVSNAFGGGLSFGALVPGLGISASASTTRSANEGTEYRVVSNPYRHLLSLALHYHQNIPDRMRSATYVEVDGKYQVAEAKLPLWYDQAFISAVPRALLFIDLPPETRFIPAAAEVAGGDVHPLFEEIGGEFAARSSTSAPQYPGGAPRYAEERRRYWEWFSEHFDETIAMEAVEKAAGGKPLNWIAYRAALPGVGEPFLHLWVAGRGKFDTGTFAYNFVKRGFKHGLRIVGTLKSEPDLNVLAVFEK
jgi:hypothetical protein